MIAFSIHWSIRYFIPICALLIIFLSIQVSPVYAQQKALSGNQILILDDMFDVHSKSYSPPNPMGMDVNDPRKLYSPLDEQKDLNTQLFLAIGDDDTEYAAALLSQGADPNADVPGTDMKFLMAAQSAEMVILLLDNGADPKAVDSQGATALHYHVTGPAALEILPVLLKTNSNINAVAHGWNGETPLLSASQLFFEGGEFDHAEQVIRLLKNHGADINAADNYGYTLLMIGVTNKKAKMVKLMLKLGARTDPRNNDGLTALDLARSLKFTEIISLLEAAAPNP